MPPGVCARCHEPLPALRHPRRVYCGYTCREETRRERSGVPPLDERTRQALDELGIPEVLAAMPARYRLRLSDFAHLVTPT